MNDFTREELKEIYNGLDYSWLKRERNLPLLEKIEHLINTYHCKHEAYMSMRMPIFGDNKTISRCRNCAEFYKDNMK